MRLPKIDVGFQKIAAKQLRRLVLVDKPKGWGLLPNALWRIPKPRARRRINQAHPSGRRFPG